MSQFVNIGDFPQTSVRSLNRIASSTTNKASVPLASRSYAGHAQMFSTAVRTYKNAHSCFQSLSSVPSAILAPLLQAPLPGNPRKTFCVVLRWRLSSGSVSDLGHFCHQCCVQLLVGDVIAVKQLADAFIALLAPAQGRREEGEGAL